MANVMSISNASEYVETRIRDRLRHCGQVLGVEDAIKIFGGLSHRRNCVYKVQKEEGRFYTWGGVMENGASFPISCYMI